MNNNKSEEHELTLNKDNTLDSNNLESIKLNMGNVNSLDEERTKKRKEKKPPEPLYNTLEYKFYFGFLLFSVIYMFYTTIKISDENHPSFKHYKDYLSEGWMFNRLIDLSDGQFNGFRSRLFLLIPLFIIHIILSRLITIIKPNAPTTRVSGFRSLIRYPKLGFNLVFSLLLILFLHGSSSIKILVLISLNFIIGKTLRRTRWNPIVTWIFNILTLLLSSYIAQVKFGDIFDPLSFLDEYKGLLPRWDIHYNISTLRLISFNLDYYWSPSSTQMGQSMTDDVEYLSTSKQRTQYPLPSNEFTFANYLAYVLYAPLYLAGPIITFNDFMYQIIHSNPNLTFNMILKYLFRLTICILIMEFMLHYMYVQALCKAGNFEDFNSYELLMISFFSLKFIWLKLLIIWRVFRCWAMADGIDTVENMQRCMTNNYSVQGFWKGWHCSYNRWLVRYIYIPTGGARYAFLNIWVIFTFVALWHDTELKLLTWGWLICLFFLPEMIAAKASKRWSDKKYYRHLRALGGTLNVLMLMTANLVGFALGLDGLWLLLSKLLSWQGLFQIFLFLSFLYADVQVMIEIRNHEARKAYQRKQGKII